MTTVDFEPLSVTVPLWGGPSAFSVGDSRIGARGVQAWRDARGHCSVVSDGVFRPMEAVKPAEGNGRPSSSRKGVAVRSSGPAWHGCRSRSTKSWAAG